MDAVEIRVLGCLLEKQRTTPEQYPLSLKALRLACNQSTNRDPVVEYDERTVHHAAQELGRRGWTRLASGQGSRAIKYRQLFVEELGLARPEVAVLTVLFLRGPQTPGELKQRTERLHGFADLDELQAALDGLITAGRVERLARQPGQKEERYTHLFGDEVDPEPKQAAVGTDVAPTPRGQAERDDLEERVTGLEAEVARLRARLDELE